MRGALAVAIALVPSLLLATPQQRQGVALSAEEIFKRCSPAVVSIVTTVSGQSAERGAGTVVAPDGFVVTNAHVISRADEIYIDIGAGELLVAAVRFYDEERDIAVLSVTPRLERAVRIATADLKVGQPIYAIGNPRGLRATISEGIVSGLRHDATRTLIQHTAPLSPGSSGGPLLSPAGQLVGINTFEIADSQNLNFAVAAAEIRAAVSAATATKDSLPAPATARRQRLDVLINDAYAKQNYHSLAELASEAVAERLQPPHYYAALAGIGLVEVGRSDQARPFLEFAAAQVGPDSPSKQTARWYLIRVLFDRVANYNDSSVKGALIPLARAFLASAESPLHGDQVDMRKAATVVVASLTDPSGLWTDESGALLGMFKRNIFRIRCEPTKCWVEVLQHPEAKAADMRDFTLGSGVLDNDSLVGTYTIGLVLGPATEPFAVWKQDVEFALNWSPTFDALEGTVTYRTGEVRANIREAGAFLRDVLSPRTLSVRLVPAQ
jgi:S1-C subfamily serine protease